MKVFSTGIVNVRVRVKLVIPRKGVERFFDHVEAIRPEVFGDPERGS